MPKLVSMAQAVTKARTLRTMVIMYANGYMFFTCAYCAEISEVMNTHLRCFWDRNPREDPALLPADCGCCVALIAIGTHVKWKKWMVPLGANRFDDGYGNTGPDKDVEAGKFVVVPATLQVRTG